MHASRGIAARILLVDDQPDQVEMYQLALEHAGFAVEGVMNGAGAVDRALREPPDAIVLDVRLPDMTGWDVCATLKGDPRTAHVPIIILTAVASPTLSEQAARAGCAASLLKPCFPEDLTQIVRRVLAAT